MNAYPIGCFTVYNAHSLSGECMMADSPKYTLGDKHPELDLYRIVAVRDIPAASVGSVGGWVGSEANLSHSGDCWIFPDAQAYEDALLCDDALLFDNARMYGKARVGGRAQVMGDASVFGNAQVSGDSLLLGRARVRGNAVVVRSRPSARRYARRGRHLSPPFARPEKTNGSSPSPLLCCVSSVGD